MERSYECDGKRVRVGAERERGNRNRHLEGERLSLSVRQYEGEITRASGLHLCLSLRERPRASGLNLCPSLRGTSAAEALTGRPCATAQGKTMHHVLSDGETRLSDGDTRCQTEIHAVRRGDPGLGAQRWRCSGGWLS